MKKINLIEWLWKTDSHEKQSPQRFARYAAMLIMLLTLCVGQMWGATWSFSGTSYMYFHNKAGWTDSGKMLFIGKDKYSSVYTMSAVSNTKLWVVQLPSSGWSDASYMAVAGGGSVWGSGEWGPSNRTNATHYTNTYTSGLSTSSTQYYVFIPNNTSNNASISLTYLGNAISNLNKTITVKAKVSTNGGGSYSETTSPGTLSASSKKFTAYNSCASATSLSSGTISCGYTATTTLTAADATGYDFVGWYNSSGTQQTTSKTLTIYPTDNTTYYAYYKEKQYSLTFSHNGHGTISVGGSTVASGSTANVNYFTTKTLVASPSTGYNFSGWTMSGSNTGSVTIGNAANASTTIKATNTGATVTAGFTAKTYTITLKKNGADCLSDGSATATYNSGSVTSATYPTYTDYRCDGYYTAADGGDLVLNTDGTLEADVDGYTDGSGNWTKDGDATLYAHWTYDVTNYTVNFGVGTSYTSLGGLTAYNNNTSASISTGASVRSGHSITFTASPNTGYEVEGWYTNAACTLGKHDAGSLTYTASVTGDMNVYVKYVEKTWSVAFTAGTGGTVTTPAATPQTVGQVTGISIAATPGTGYTFASWSSSSGGSFTSGTSTNSNTFKPTANTTVTASFNETMSSLSTSNSYDAGNPSYAAPTVSGSATTIGYGTTRTITATAAGTGYTFAGWTLTNCTRTDGGGATANPITVRSNGDGAAATVVANYTEDLTSTWYVEGDASGPFLGWKADATTMLQKKTGYSTGNDVYWTATVTAGQASPSDTQWEFKIYNSAGANEDAKWYGWGTDASYYWLTNENHSLTLSNSTNNVRFKPYLAGDYEFHFNTSTKVLTVTWPVFNQVRISAASLSDATNVGNFDLSDPVSNVRTVTRSLKANTTYTFKVVYNSEWYGNNSKTFTRETSTSSNTRTVATSSDDMTLTTDYAGDYTFKFNQSTKALSIDFPEAYKVTYGKGAVDGSSGNNCSAKDIDNGNASVTSNSTWVKKDHRVVMTAPNEDSGYTFDGWFDNNSSTGDAITTAKNCTITVASAKTYYACYHEHKTAITINTDGHGTITTPNPNNSPYSLGVATTQAINATANEGYHWNTWTTSGNAALGTTATTAINTAKGNGTEGGTGTVTATFTPNTYTVRFHRNGGAGNVVEQNFTYDVAQNLTANTYTKTGYNFAGWATASDGAVVYNNEEEVSNLTSENGATFHLYAKWTPNPYTVVLDKQTSAEGYGGNAGTVANQTVTFDATPATVSGTMPSAANGYAFMGFYSATGGNGRRFIDPSGNWVTSAGDTISGGNWVKPAGITLYAYYKKAEITLLTFDAGIVEPGDPVGVTPTISPTPVGTTTICWTILHDDDTPLSPQPVDMTYSAGKLTFTAPSYSGTYKVEAVLHVGSGCSGTTLDTKTANFLVAGSHSVTVNYKCGSDVIASSTSVTGHPTEWSDEFTAPDIFGYTFSSWTAADGVTIKDSEHEDVTSSTESTIKIKAIYAGSLTASYTRKNIIYFKDNLNWTDPANADAHIYVNLLTGDYWNTDNGTGNQNVTNRNLQMDRVPGTTNVFYYDYGSKPTSLYVSFTKESMDNYEHFYQESGKAHVVFPSRALDALDTDNKDGLGLYAATPMFVPLANQTPVEKNNKHAEYYNDGYWTKYLPGTGYWLDIYQADGTTSVKAIQFTSADELMPMKVVTDLEGSHTYKFQLKREGDVYYGNNGTMTYEDHGQNTAWDFFHNSPFNMCTIVTNAAGDYTFNLSYSPNSGGTNNRLRMEVDYPVADGDYRLVYTDDTRSGRLKPSAIVNKVNNGTDIVSFFVRPGENPVLRIQQASINKSTGAITWNEYPTSGTPTNQITGTIASTLTAGGTDVYNFNLSMNGSGALSVASVEKYDGNYYIRTDAANSKWDNYRTDPDHLMTYSEYSIEHGGYTHYYTHWVQASETGRKNVKFVIANDYSPCISDTLAREDASGTWANINHFIEEGGDLKRDANVRFMWDKRDNSVSRAYVDGAQGDWSTNFLYMLNVEGGDDKIKKEDGTALTDHKITFKDNGNWMYEANIKAQPEAQIKLLSNWGTSNTITQYFRGAVDDTETLLGGSGSTWYDIRVIYDFKTNRLIAGLKPSGTIDDQMAIHADVMFIREHHGDIAQVTFAEKGGKMGAITDINTAYGVLQFSKWTVNNKSKEDGHSPLSPLLSQFERDLFYVSFPFRVKMEDVFGFGTYGRHWIIEEYDGASRAANGYWQESGPNWKFVFNRKNKFFEPGIGYIIALDLDEMVESADIWANTDRVELYFPSYGTMDDITKSTVTYDIPEHECTINRSNESNGHGGTLGPDYDRRVKDSHWNVLGVPTYVNPDAPTFANTTWTTTAGETSIGPNFLYQWTKSDNSVSAVSAKDYTYHAMHAYLVQYCGDVTWSSSVSVTPPAEIAARRISAEKPQNAEFKLELMQNEKTVDQAFVKLSDDEHVTTGFEFNYDLSKEFNRNKANIYTLITSDIDGDLSITEAAGNVLPMTEQTTVVPVGVKIAKSGDYTFAIPSGTSGVGVTLVDLKTGVRTNLALFGYDINLEAGDYNDRFLLEISPIQHIAEGVEEVNGEGLEANGVRKVLIDNVLYIIRDGKVFDAQGKRLH